MSGALGQIAAAAVFLAFVALFGLMLTAYIRGANTPPEKRDGQMLLRPSRAILYAGLLLGLFAAMSLALAVSAAFSDGTGLRMWVGVVLAAVLGAGVWFCIARYRGERVLLGPEGIEHRTWMGTRTYPWDGLTGADLSTRAVINTTGSGAATRVPRREVTASFEDGGVVRVASNMIGQAAFEAELRRRSAAQGVPFTTNGKVENGGAGQDQPG